MNVLNISYLIELHKNIYYYIFNLSFTKVFFWIVYY